MNDFETFSIALREPFDMNVARHQAREALQLGYRVAVTATRSGERVHVFTAFPIGDGTFWNVSLAERSSGRRPSARAAVDDGFGAVSGLFRPPGSPVFMKRDS